MSKICPGATIKRTRTGALETNAWLLVNRKPSKPSTHRPEWWLGSLRRQWRRNEMVLIRAQYRLVAEAKDIERIRALPGVTKKVKQFGHFLHIQVTFILVFFTHELEAAHVGMTRTAFLLTHVQIKSQGLTVSSSPPSVPPPGQCGLHQ